MSSRAQPFVRSGGARTRPVVLPRTRFIGWPVLATVVVLFAVSGGLLWMVGLNYDGLTGGAAAKIHPSTYMIILIFAWAALSSGSPPAYVIAAARRRPASLLLFAAMLVLFLHTAAIGAPGLAGSVDTYLAPPLLVVLMDDLDTSWMRRIEIAVHAVMAINALMGIGEFASGHLVFPYRFDGAVFPTDLRSTALQGHPLANAAITSCYVVALIATGARGLPAITRLPAIAIQFGALVTFGGRSGIVAALVFGGFQMLLKAHRSLRQARVSLLGAASVVLLLTMTPLMLGGLVATGFFERLLTRFANDGGSAYARVQMLDLLQMVPFRDLLVGPDATLMDSLRRVIGLEWGIENPIIRTVLYQGILVTLLLVVAVTLFLRELIKTVGPGTFAPMLVFIVLINTSESLGGKTTMLTKFAVILVCLFRPAKVVSQGARSVPKPQRWRDPAPASRRP